MRARAPTVVHEQVYYVASMAFWRFLVSLHAAFPS